MIAPEFSRPERIDMIGAGDREVEIVATESERAALAGRFGLKAVERLDARFVLRRDPSGITARGKVRAAVIQSCVITEEAIPVAVEETVELRFVSGDAPEGDEIELNEDALDTVMFEGGAIDLGEAAAETMALALDPFPRGPNAAATLRAAGVISEEEAKPLGALAGLKAALEKRQG
jgi:uncharacterized metal-binding protein YceD (DUF177 family)